MNNKLKAKLLYLGENVEIFMCNDYVISRHRGNYLCECSLKYNRKVGVECKHIKFIKEVRK